MSHHKENKNICTKDLTCGVKTKKSLKCLQKWKYNKISKLPIKPLKVFTSAIH